MKFPKFFAFFVFFLSSCGGGGKDQGEPDASPPITIGEILDIDEAADAVREGLPIGTDVGLQAQAVGSDTPSYTLLDDAGGRFAIDAQTGIVSLAAILDFETAQSHDIAIEARLASGETSTQQFQIAVLDNLAPLVSIDFPVSGQFEGDTVALRGSVVDPEDDELVVRLLVDGVEVALSVDAEGRFSLADLALGEGNDVAIEVQAEDLLGEIGEPARVALNRNPSLVIPRRVAMSADSQTAYVIDDGRVLRLTPATGVIEIVSGAGVGTGPTLVGGISIAVDDVNALAYVGNLAQDSIIRVDLATGTRSVLSSSSVGTGAPFVFSLDVLVDAANDRLLALDQGNIIAVDLANGDRSTVAASADSPGASCFGGRAMTANLARTTVYCIGVIAGGGQILNTRISAIDVATGVMTIVSEDNIGNGDDFQTVEDMVLDEANNRLLVTDQDAEAIVAVDIATGDRTPLSTSGLGSGPTMQRPFGLDYAPATGTTFVIDIVEDGLIGIDAQGNREVLVSSSVGPGTHIEVPQAQVLDAANRRLFVSSEDFDGATSTTASLYVVDLATGSRTLISGPTLGTGPSLERPRFLSYVAATDTIYASDADVGAILSVNVTTGERVIVSGAAQGAGPALSFPKGIVATDDTLYVVTGNSLFEIDPTTGDRTELLGPNTTALEPLGGTGMRLDLANSRLLVADNLANAGVWAIALPGLAQTLVADDDLGAGSNLASASDLAVSADGSQIVVVENSARRLSLVDAASGDRVRLSGITDGRGTFLKGLVTTSYDQERDIAWIIDIAHEGVIAVDIASGDRVFVSK